MTNRIYWKSDNCGQVHEENPSDCVSCGFTVFSQYRNSTKFDSNHQTESSAVSGESDEDLSGEGDWIMSLLIAFLLVSVFILLLISV